MMDATNANGDLNQSSAPEAQAMPGDESAEQFSVTITANGDGTYSVATSDSDAAQDDPNAQGESGPQTASSIEEVCQIVEQILSAEAGEDGAEAGGDANAPVNDPQAVWQQLAKKTDAKRSM